MNWEPILIVTTVMVITSATCLFAQYRHQIHELRIKHGSDLWHELLRRIEFVEKIKASDFNKDEFEELKSKVDALRISIGIRGSSR